MGGRLILPPLLLIAVLSGPAVMLGTSQQIYYEAMLWSWALASLFAACALRGLFAPRLFPGAVLCGMAAAAGCALLTRPTTGIGLYAAFAAIGVLLLCREGGRAVARLLAPLYLRPRSPLPPAWSTPAAGAIRSAPPTCACS
jgi:hypothetical protein